MSDLVLKLQQNLESLKKMGQTPSENGESEDLEYWSARELMSLLGYAQWRQFEGVIQKAQESCKNSNQEVSHHFAGSRKMVDIGSGSERSIPDYLLTRYACYLVAQNGDSRKPEIAFAQTYFAIQTRKQEVLEQRIREDRRLEARQKHREIEDKLESTVYQRGIKLPKEFGEFKNEHIRALYGGITAKQLKQQRDIPEKRALADFDTEVELSAKHFSLAMTDHNIKAQNLQGKPRLISEVVKNSQITRKALLDSGIVPEGLKPEEDLKKIEQRRQKESRLLQQTTD